jgi:hypothetical protein
MRRSNRQFAFIAIGVLLTDLLDVGGIDENAIGDDGEFVAGLG